MQRLILPALVTCSMVGLAALSVCTGTPTATSASSTTTTSSAPATSLPASPTAGKSTASTPSATTGDDPTGHGPGCAANNVKIPVGAQTVTTADLDHDGREDKLFLQHNTSELGVHTASGDTFSRKFAVSEASEVGAQAFVVADGSSLVLLSGSRQSYLFAVVNCALVVTKNVQGRPYTFDNGFTKPGTGVGCTHDKNGLTLVGLLAAKDGKSGEYDITRTVIEPQHSGRSARNGRVIGGDPGLSQHAAFDKVRTGFPCSPGPAV